MEVTSEHLTMWGRHDHLMDDKFRLLLPHTFRPAVLHGLMITTGLGPYLRVYPTGIWKTLEQKLNSSGARDELDPSFVLMQNSFAGGTVATMDKENRITIPLHLREWAGIRPGDTALLIGNGDRLEIWNTANWQERTRLFTEELLAQASVAVFGARRNVESGGDSIPTQPV